MWDLNPLQLLLALGLDIVLGSPRWMPHLDRGILVLAKRFSPLASRSGGSGVAGAVLVWGATAASLILPLELIRILLGSGKLMGPVLVGIVEVLVVYQCIATIDLSRRIRSVVHQLRRGNFDAARDLLAKVTGAETTTLDETGISRIAIAAVASGCRDRFLGPLFWTAALGPAGALIHRVTNLLASPGEGLPPACSRFCSRTFVILNYLPTRLLALLSETFRKFRSLGKIRREARKHPDPNGGWAEAALAHDLGVCLEDAPTGLVYHPAGDAPTASHLAEALVWFWRIIAFAALLALLAVK